MISQFQGRIKEYKLGSSKAKLKLATHSSYLLLAYVNTETVNYTQLYLFN